MERCPNCGAPARPGAKFCTTCGYRLPAAAVAAPADPVETSSSSVASWPAPPAPASAPETDADATDQAATETASAPSSTDDVVVPASGPESEAADETRAAMTIGAADATAANTDEVLSSSWPSTTSSSQPSPWTLGGASDDSGGPAASDGDQADRDNDAGTGVGVSEETVIVAEPASQYEGWSAAVVEEVAPPSASTGTNIARATALLDELRLLLPVLGATGTDAGSGTNVSLAGELEAAADSAKAAADDRHALRAALNEARDNPRDIQTILALSVQTDAAIALLDEHERLIATIERAIGDLRPAASGIYPSSR